ncbi:MAG TPA: hypothetical protein VFR09_01135 [Alphaproteobacteria bacterium]|nr:hypothetical protein [Alphaproteobacteria bacterium]
MSRHCKQTQVAKKAAKAMMGKVKDPRAEKQARRDAQASYKRGRPVGSAAPLSGVN